ncbi:MAG: aspartate/glutamate racemase family protein [Litoreibacter sp.]
MIEHKNATGFLGILMLDTSFPRILDDAGNSDSYPFEVRIKVVEGAGALDVVRSNKPSPELVAAFCDAAKDLERQGAVGLISTCGFLIHIQDEIARAVQIPVMVSALSLYPLLARLFVGAPIGILTASSASLNGAALAAAGISESDVEIEGLETCGAFRESVLTGKSDQVPMLDEKAIESAVTERARRIVQRKPETAAFLLECGNLPPYSAAITAATGKRVYSILHAAQFLMQD